MGSWKRTITSPFRKACTILSPQLGGGGRDDHQHSGNGKKKPRHHHHHHHKGPAAAMASLHGGVGGDDDAAEMRSSTQLYGDVMACAYEDVQVMWSMLDNKARFHDAAS